MDVLCWICKCHIPVKINAHTPCEVFRYPPSIRKLDGTDGFGIREVVYDFFLHLFFVFVSKLKKGFRYLSMCYALFFCNLLVNLSFSATFTNKEVSELGPKLDKF